MTSLFGTNTRMALQSIRTNRMRSFLTMLGIVIGVASVIMTVSLGEGLRRQVNDTNQGSNSELVTVRSGHIAQRDASGSLTQINYLGALGSNTLTEQDLEALKAMPEARTVVPLATISGLATNFDKKSYKDATIIATTGGLPEVLGQGVAFGSFFDDTSSRSIAVIGTRVAEELFGENVPLGKILNLRGQDFIVGGVMDEFKTNPLSNVTDLNKAIFISYPVAKTLAGGSPNTYQFMLLPKEGVAVEQLVKATEDTLTRTHGGQTDYTVLRASETELIARSTVSIATAFVAGIAGISLLVGGIGIMNIMFVAVTERTREIGVRKSLGATNRQIYSQFLIEAAVISTVGGAVGILIALAGNAVFRITGDLQPAVTWQIVALAVGVSMAVGIIFGTIPAIKAARKDPIESLRYE
jgi:putative ABC transport system permease protein